MTPVCSLTFPPRKVRTHPEPGGAPVSAEGDSLHDLPFPQVTKPRLGVCAFQKLPRVARTWHDIAPQCQQSPSPQPAPSGRLPVSDGLCTASSQGSRGGESGRSTPGCPFPLSRLLRCDCALNPKCGVSGGRVASSRCEEGAFVPRTVDVDHRSWGTDECESLT